MKQYGIFKCDSLNNVGTFWPHSAGLKHDPWSTLDKLQDAGFSVINTSMQSPPSCGHDNCTTVVYLLEREAP